MVMTLFTQGLRGAQARRLHKESRTFHATVLLQSLFRGMYV